MGVLVISNFTLSLSLRFPFFYPSHINNVHSHTLEREIQFSTSFARSFHLLLKFCPFFLWYVGIVKITWTGQTRNKNMMMIWISEKVLYGFCLKKMTCTLLSSVMMIFVDCLKHFFIRLDFSCQWPYKFIRLELSTKKYCCFVLVFFSVFKVFRRANFVW